MPEEAARRHRLGLFYYRPPGGESWPDVALRLRAALGDLRRGYPDGRVLLVAHDALILLLRYLVEGLSLARLVELAAGTPLDNGSLTSWRRVRGAAPGLLQRHRTPGGSAAPGATMTPGAPPCPPSRR
jgi:broad specificity phosphatase PhoE